MVGRVDGIVGSWDLGMKNQPVWTWPQGFAAVAILYRSKLNYLTTLDTQHGLGRGRVSLSFR
ncbi:MAG: hypothetical protein WDN48_03865 [Pseudolabrys sp.]